LFAILHRVDARSLSVVANLHDHFRTVTVNGIGQSRQTRDETIVGKCWLVQRSRPDRPSHSRSFEDQKPNATTSTSFVVSNVEIGNGSVIATVLIHGWKDDAITSFDRTNAALR
jgi:hypothetical protein